MTDNLSLLGITTNRDFYRISDKYLTAGNISEYKIKNLSTVPSLQAAASVTQNMMSASTELVLFNNNNMLSLLTLNTNTIIQGMMKWIFVAVGANTYLSCVLNNLD